MRTWLSLYVKGFFMGAADSIPGVSGGTIALITGIYERLVGAIAAADPRIISHLLRIHDADDRAVVREMLEAMDLGFLLVLGAGIATAIVATTRVVELAYQGYPGFTYAFFFGLIGASAIVLYRHVSLDTPGRIGAAIAGFAIAYVIAGKSAGGLAHSPLVIFLSGALAVSAMILPGVSGAFILVLLGQYTYLSATLHDFVDALVALVMGGDSAAALVAATTVVTFLGGALVGLLTISRIVNRALKSYHEATLAFLVSLMVGALRFPVKAVVATRETWILSDVALVLVSVLLGAGAVLALDYFTDDLEYAEVEGIGGSSPKRAD